MREMVRDLGEVTKWTDNGKELQMTHVMLVNVLLRDEDVYTDVEIDHFGQLNVGGYDGVDTGWAKEACDLSDEDIDRVYAAMLVMGAEGKDEERWETVKVAHDFLEEVTAIVEKELDSFACVRMYQERMRGVVWSEGVMVDTSYDEAQGMFLNTRSISIHRRCEDGPLMFIRYESNEDGGTSTMPFHGSAKEAADYLLEEFRECFDDEDDWEDAA